MLASTYPRKALAMERPNPLIVSSLPRGTGFTRFAIALCRAKGDIMNAAEIAQHSWRDTPAVGMVLRSAAAAGTTTDSAWAEPLVEYQAMVGEFVALLRPATIIGRLSGVRRVPFDTKFLSQSAGASVGWVGQGMATAVGELALASETLGAAKAAGIVALTAELVRSSKPSAEALVRADLISAMAKFLDQQFISPAVAAVANVSPASVTNGLTPVTSSGSTAAAITADFRLLFAKLIDAGILLAAPALVMTPTIAVALATKLTTGGALAFPDIGPLGGKMFGIPVLTSAAVPSTVSGGSIVVLLDAAEILLADDGQMFLDSSEQATLQLRDDPQTGAQNLVSLWSNNLSAVRAVAYMNWKRRRDNCVAYIDAVNY
jgi:HK97 family phage major capsid protein